MSQPRTVPSFAPSAFGSLGVEFEGTVIDAATGRPSPVAQEIALEASPHVSRGKVTTDLFASTLELATGICGTLDEARNDLADAWSAVQPALERRDAAVLAMGLHPTARLEDLEIADEPQSQEIAHRLAWLGRRAFTTGIHVHIGMPDGDTALQHAAAIQPVMPVLLALSASSPFAGGRATGLASTRIAVFDAIPRTGPMPSFTSWAQYDATMDTLLHADAIRTVRDVWWDCRPQPDFGTLEIRILDSVPSLDDVASLVALAWCAAVGAERLAGFAVPEAVSNENRWRAVRDGHRARMIVDAAGRTESVGTFADRTVEALIPTAEQLGCTRELDGIIGLAQGHGAHQELFDPRTASSTDDARAVERAMATLRVNW